MTKQCVITRLTKERRGYLIEKTNFFIEREIATARPAKGRVGKGSILLIKRLLEFKIDIADTNNNASLDDDFNF